MKNLKEENNISLQKPSKNDDDDEEELKSKVFNLKNVVKEEEK